MFYWPLFIVGMLLIVGGTAYAAPALTMSVVATAPPTVDCSAWPASCTVGAQISNTGGWGTPPFTVYFVYKNTAGQTVLIDTQTTSVAAGQTAPVTDSAFTPKSVPGAGSTELGFSVTVFVNDADNLPSPGAPQSATFSVPIQFEIEYVGVGSITVSPPGSGVTTGETTGLAGGQYYSAYWPSGTTLTVTTSAGVAPVNWGTGPGTSCPASGSGFVCTITVSQTNTAIISGGFNQPPNVIWIGNTAPGSPSSLCLSATAFTSSDPILGSCSPTGTFSLLVPSGYTWSGDLWKLIAQSGGQTLLTGNTTTVSLSFSDLSSKVTFTNGIASLNLVEAPTFPIKTPCTGPGCTGGSGSATCTLNPSSNAGVDVLVVSSSGGPIAGAMVTGAGASGITDNTGHALLCNFAVPGGNLVSHQGTINITASASGYKTGTQTVNVIEGQTTDATIQLQPGFSINGQALTGLGLDAVGAALIFMSAKFSPSTKARARGRSR